MKKGFIIEKERKIPIVDRYDVVVAGGGVAGIGAAVSAAKNGARTIVIEKNWYLGGVATAVMMGVLVIPVNKLNGFSNEFFQDLIKTKGAYGGSVVSFDPEAFKELAFQKVFESGAELLLDTRTVAPIMEGDRVKGVIVENKAGRQAILSDVVIDATGDGDISVQAGAPYVKGREVDNKMRPVSILFRIGNLDIKRIVEYAKTHPEEFTPDPNLNVLDIENGVVRISGFFAHVEKARNNGELDKDCHYLRLEAVQVENGIAFVNSTRVYGIDGTDAFAATRGYLAARKQMNQLYNFIRKYIPGGENCYLIDSSPSLGVRETRRIRGEHVLTEKEIAEKTVFPDAITTVWRRHFPGAELHSPDGGEGSAEDRASREMIIPIFKFQVPYGCLVPQKVDGLLVAGRNISVTHEAEAFTRGMYCCMTLGEAAGAAAAIASKQAISVREVDTEQLRHLLEEQGMIIDDNLGIDEE
jgi:hypothetical protein